MAEAKARIWHWINRGSVDEQGGKPFKRHSITRLCAACPCAGGMTERRPFLGIVPPLPETVCGCLSLRLYLPVCLISLSLPPFLSLSLCGFRAGVEGGGTEGRGKGSNVSW